MVQGKGTAGAITKQQLQNQTTSGSSGDTKKKKKKQKQKAAVKVLKTKKKKTSKQKVESKEEARKKNEMYLLEKEMKKGKDMDNLDIDIRKLDKKLAKMPLDETSDEENSEEDEAPEVVKNLAKESITDKKMLQKYHVDREDYMLQYADAKERPVYFEEYLPRNYKCFKGTTVTKYGGNASDAFKHLLKYTNEVWKCHTAPSLDHLSPLLLLAFPLRPTSEYANFCFNPLQAMRAWGLLDTIATNKTETDLRAFIDTYTLGSPNKKKKKDEQLSDVHTELLALHRAAEYKFPGCVRLFTELPHHLETVQTEWRRNINQVYGGKSRRAGIQHHCFATDPDGFYSCYRINEEIYLSTRGTVRYVVPENCAPNWRASVVVASATDCTFYWKTTESRETHNFLFDGGKKMKSQCIAISAKATVAWMNGPGDQDLYRLESHVPGVFLYILVENPENYELPKSFPPELQASIASGDDKWRIKNDLLVHIPKCTTSMPISLFNHSKHNGLSRLFCSEKSELKQMKISKEQYSGSPQYTTLFDHYHKTVFEICPGPPDYSGIVRVFDELAPQKAHQCIDESSAKLFGKFQKKRKGITRDAFFTYFEGHLTESPHSMDFVQDGFSPIEVQDKDVNLGKPFYYVMTRKFEEKEQMIVCAGYFNNTIWPFQPKEK